MSILIEDNLDDAEGELTEPFDAYFRNCCCQANLQRHSDVKSLMVPLMAHMDAPHRLSVHMNLIASRSTVLLLVTPLLALQRKQTRCVCEEMK